MPVFIRMDDEIKAKAIHLRLQPGVILTAGINISGMIQFSYVMLTGKRMLEKSRKLSYKNVIWSVFQNSQALRSAICIHYPKGSCSTICQGSSWKDTGNVKTWAEDFVRHFFPLRRLVRKKGCWFSILWDSNNIPSILEATLAGFGIYLTRKQIFFSKTDGASRPIDSLIHECCCSRESLRFLLHFPVWLPVLF